MGRLSFHEVFHPIQIVVFSGNLEEVLVVGFPHDSSASEQGDAQVDEVADLEVEAFDSPAEVAGNGCSNACDDDAG